MKIPKCDICGRIPPAEWEGDETGLPVMVGFQLENGVVLNVCRECVMKKPDAKIADIAKKKERELS